MLEEMWQIKHAQLFPTSLTENASGTHLHCQ